MSAFGIMTRARAAIVAALFVFVVSAAFAQEPMTVYGLAIPEQVEGYQRGPLRDYEKTNPGLGYSAPFRRQGWLIDVYFYDLGKREIPDDPKSEVVKQQLTQAKGDIFELERRGIYGKVAEKGDYTIDRGGQVKFLCSAFAFLHTQLKATVDSYLCVGSWKNKFVKFRLTAQQDNPTRDDADKFVRAWGNLLWPS